MKTARAALRRLSGPFNKNSFETTPNRADDFNILEASIEDHLNALDAGKVTCVDLVVSYLNRIATYDICHGLNAFTVFNDKVFDEAYASDERRARGQGHRPLEGIPYTLKDSYKYEGMSVTNGSPALQGLMSSEDSAIGAKLRAAGAVLIGKTNMPPMAAGGMQRGLYGRAESPYNPKYLTGAFSSGSSNGAATSITSSMAVFGMGSETVSSGRSPASNNALVCYTPSRGVLSCRGLWPLYVTCDVPVPYARSMNDLLKVLSVIATPDPISEGDFWREQKHVPIPPQAKIDFSLLSKPDALKGRIIGIPKMYTKGVDSNPHAKQPYISDDVIELWDSTIKELVGSSAMYVDFPLVTEYEDDSKSKEANNVGLAPADWNAVERGDLIAKAWDDFLKQNNGGNTRHENGDQGNRKKKITIKSLLDIENPTMLFPKPSNYMPDKFLEVRNWIDYAGLPSRLDRLKDTSIYALPGLPQALRALEAQRKCHLEDWMSDYQLDVIAFPSQGDVGLADLETSFESAEHSLKNGVKYSNGNRAIRHLGVPTVSIPMGVMKSTGMPVNITFAGRAYDDAKLLSYAYAFERLMNKRTMPPLTPSLETDCIESRPRVMFRSAQHAKLDLKARLVTRKAENGALHINVAGTANRAVSNAGITIFFDGQDVHQHRIEDGAWTFQSTHLPMRQPCLGWDLKPLSSRPVMVIVVARGDDVLAEGKLLWASDGES